MLLLFENMSDFDAKIGVWAWVIPVFFENMSDSIINIWTWDISAHDLNLGLITKPGDYAGAF